MNINVLGKVDFKEMNILYLNRNRINKEENNSLLKSLKSKIHIII